MPYESFDPVTMARPEDSSDGGERVRIEDTSAATAVPLEPEEDAPQVILVSPERGTNSSGVPI
jgi:hypothetical protein